MNDLIYICRYLNIRYKLQKQGIYSLLYVNKLCIFNTASPPDFFNYRNGLLYDLAEYLDE